MKSPCRFIAVAAAQCLCGFNIVLAADKNGVSPQVISLPSGPGSIQGLGESFQPQLNSGSGTFSVPIQLPSGPTGFAPSLSIDYHTGQGNGIVGIGWKLSGPTMVSRNMDHGLPFYIDGPNGVDDDFDGTIDNVQEIDRFSGVNLEELVALADGSLRSENEANFARYRRVGDGWRVEEKNGIQHEFGPTGASRLENNGRMFAWLLQRTTDTNGNAAEFSYMTDAGSPGQKYLREVRWARPQAFYAAVLSYDSSRPDVHADFKSGFEIRTGLRLSRIDVIAQGVPPSPTALVGDLNGDGLPDSLIRRYELEYEANALISRLTKVTLRGADGVTSLPPITFQYTNWTPPDNVALSFTRSAGDPSIGLDSTDVELIDMNQDGLPDLLNATQNLHRIHLNQGMTGAGRLAWDTVGKLVGNAPAVNLGLPSVHLSDHSADGNSDLVHKISNSAVQCFFNSGKNAWENRCNLNNTDTWPLWPFENSRSRTMDADHNRLHDILFTGDNSYRLWMLLPGGRYGREISLPVLSDGTQAFRFDDPGARIADVNGDRISDLAWVQSTRVVYWASCGRGNFDGPIFLPLSGSLLATEIPRVELADINGDALSDLILVRPAASPNGIQYFVNRGIAGFATRRTILGLPSVQAGDATRRADMNGNGSVDFLISNSARAAGTREQFMDFVPGVRPNLLTRIENGLGSVITLHYESSVDQMVRAQAAGNPWESTMPISVPVLARITESDSRGNEFVREFAYRIPHFDADKQEFRGFTSAEAREIGDDSAPTKVMTSTFDNGTLASCRKGMMLSHETTDSAGSLFDRVENTVNHRLIENSLDGRQVCFAFNEAVDTFVSEQTNTPIHLRAEYQLDNFGNTVQENRIGIAAENGDEQFVEKTFAYDFVNWRLDRMSRSTSRDGNGAKVAEDLFTYDSRGNLLEHRRWLNIGDRSVLAVRNEYDAFGNVVRMFDANGHSRSIQYDDSLHTFPTSELVHLESYDLSTTAHYDLVLGTMVSSLDFAGAPSTYQYDGLGRLTLLESPGEARTTFEYTLGNPISRVVTRVREDLGSGETFDTFAYSDGLGRNLGSKIEGEDGQWRFVGAGEFNNRKLESIRWLPYHTSSNNYEIPDVGQPHQTMSYDAPGRTLQTINPDGTLMHTVYEPLVRHEHDENDSAGPATPKTLRMDGLGRLVEVIERNGIEEAYHTQYSWNTLSNLIEIFDAQGNTKSMVYDSLQRSILLHDPDRGSMTYEYDDVGNLIRTTDASEQQIRYEYDFANRLISENYLDQGGGPNDPLDVRYAYDLASQNVDFGDGGSATAAFTGGRLASVVDLSGEEHRSYDARGNAIWLVKRIRDPELEILTSYKTGFAYDTMDRVVQIDYPDGDRCSYAYNSASFLETAGGGLGGQAIISGAAYEPTGQLSQLTYGNGVVTNYTYDSRDRLASLRTVSPPVGDLINYSYAYDPVSNITRIDDLRPLAGAQAVPESSPRRNTQLFGYDGLYRLTQVKYAPAGGAIPTHGQIDYAYDRIGNMVTQTTPPLGQTGHIPDPKVGVGTMSTGGAGGSSNRNGRLPGDPPGPHALTTTQAGGSYEYDDNGNMTRLDGAAMSWDFKDRLVQFQKGGINARYTYDYTGRRTVKLLSQGKRSAETLYINPNFEIRPDRAPIKYVFNGATRLAQVKGMLDPTRPRLQRLWLSEGWNLLTIAVQTSQTASELFGGGSQVYEWTGAAYRKVAPAEVIPIAKPLWVEVAAAHVALARGVYLPPIDPVAIPAGQNLIPWPRLEPFVPQRHLSFPVLRVQSHDPQQFDWLLRDPTLPANVADMCDSFSSAGAMWLNAPTESSLLTGATDDEAVVSYHGDHLGSAHVLTDRQGALIQEVAYYPFGEQRHAQGTGVFSGESYDFTQKEQDAESGLHYFEERYLASGLGRFASVDPKYAAPNALSSEEQAEHLAQPQDLNIYAYSRNNPIRFIDPTGLSPEDGIEEIAAGALNILTLAAQGKLVPPTQSSSVSSMIANMKPLTGIAKHIQAEPLQLAEAGYGNPISAVIRLGARLFSRSAPTAAKVEAEAVKSAVTTATKTTTRHQTLSGVGPYRATTAGEHFGQRRALEHLRSTPNGAATPVSTHGQYELAEQLGRRALKEASAKTVK